MSFQREELRSPYCGRRAFLAALGLAVTGISAATEADRLFPGDSSAVRFVDSLPPYVPDGRVSGTISLWGQWAGRRIKPYSWKIDEDFALFFRAAVLGGSQANLISQKYPLTRIIPAFIDRVPGEPIDPKLREFLRYILGREGQRAVLTQSGYLPLGMDAIREQLEKLV